MLSFSLPYSLHLGAGTVELLCLVLVLCVSGGRSCSRPPLWRQWGPGWTRSTGPWSSWRDSENTSIRLRHMAHTSTVWKKHVPSTLISHRACVEFVLHFKRCWQYRRYPWCLLFIRLDSALWRPIVFQQFNQVINVILKLHRWSKTSDWLKLFWEASSL